MARTDITSQRDSLDAVDFLDMLTEVHRQEIESAVAYWGAMLEMDDAEQAERDPTAAGEPAPAAQAEHEQ